MLTHRSLRLMVAAALLSVAPALPACSRPSASDRLAATGTILADEVVVPVPVLVVPTPDIAVGLGAADGGGFGGPGAAGLMRSTPTTIVAATSLGTFSLVTSVPVEAGSAVRAGEVLARLDARMLEANVASARAASAQSRANRDLLGSALDELSSNRATLASTRAKLARTIADLQKTRAQLARQLASARTALARLEALGGGGLPPGVPPTGTVPPGAPSPAALRVAVARLTAGLAKLDAGLAKARAGLAKLDSAGAKLSDARSTLRNTRPLADVAVSLSDSAVALALARLDEATVRAPSDGVVLTAAHVGDVLAPGAPLVRLRPDARARVKLWLDSSELAGVSAGDAASVRIDSRPGEVFSAKVTVVGAQTAFPPTSLATRIIHMTRAVPVQVTLDSNVTLPPGTPADVTISTR